MPQVYIRYFGTESSNSLLKEYGIEKEEQNQNNTKLPTPSPNCREPNKVNARFCIHCDMILRYDAYIETLEEQKKKGDKLAVIENQMNAMQSQLETLISALGNLTDQNQVNKTAEFLFKSGILKK